MAEVDAADRLREVIDNRTSGQRPDEDEEAEQGWGHGLMPLVLPDPT